MLWLAETRFLFISFASCLFFWFSRCFFVLNFFFFFFIPARYHKALSCLFLTSSQALSFQQQAVSTLSFFFLTHKLFLHVIHTNIYTLKHTHMGTVLMHDPVSPCVLMECVPPCSDRPGFGEEAPGVPLSSGPPTPLRAQTFSSFSPSKSYSRQSSSSDTELSLTPKTGKIPDPT